MGNAESPAEFAMLLTPGFSDKFSCIFTVCQTIFCFSCDDLFVLVTSYEVATTYSPVTVVGEVMYLTVAQS